MNICITLLQRDIMQILITHFYMAFFYDQSKASSKHNFL